MISTIKIFKFEDLRRDEGFRYKFRANGFSFAVEAREEFKMVYEEHLDREKVRAQDISHRTSDFQAESGEVKGHRGEKKSPR